MNKEKYDGECLGIVKEIKTRGLDFSTIVMVEYEVDGIKYVLKETLKLKSEAIKLGFLPIGQRQIPKVKCKIGESIIVLYNKSNPEKSHIKGNDGIINC